MNLVGLLDLIVTHHPYTDLAASLRAGTSARALALEAAKPAVLAALYRDLGRPIVVLTSRTETAKRFRDELSVWTGSPTDVHLFPEPDVLPYEPIGSDPSTLQERLSVLRVLREHRDRAESSSRSPIVVTTVHALLQRTSPPSGLSEATTKLSVGQQADLIAVSRAWTDFGYESVPIVRVPGEFSHRGGILDVFPPESQYPIRIDFFGDEIESIRHFDPNTQRSISSVEAVTIGPPRELVPSNADVGQIADQIGLAECPPEVQERLWREIDQVITGQPGALAERYAGLFLSATLLDHLLPDTLLVVDEPDAIAAAAETLERQAEELRSSLFERGELPPRFPSPLASWESLASRLSELARLELRFAEPIDEDSTDTAPIPTVDVAFGSLPVYGGRLRVLLDDLRQLAASGARIVVISQQSARLAALLEEHGLAAYQVEDVQAAPAPGAIALVRGGLTGGWQLPDRSSQAGEPGGESIIVLSDAEIFGYSKPRRTARRRPAAIDHARLLAEIAPGDYVVHIEHGIGRFAGVVQMTRNDGGGEREYLLLEYGEGDKLYVPADHLDRVSRYIGSGDQPPTLTRLGTQEWARAKEKVRRSVRNIAGELLDIYAARQLASGHAFTPDTVWQQEMELAFPYVETPDQVEAITAVKADMESQQPMDRLICGDVGYGKTEIALRAAFKAVMDGRQVAVLVPTTVLAQQHANTFRERLGSFPIRIEMLSRFRSEREQREVVAGLKDGSVDICIGTHRLIQKDVEFKDLGLVVVDEEQRFGVAHKERLKQLRREVDVLTLTATPIPRTLHMALVGIRDLSTIDTPPEERLPIKTYLTEYDDRLIREAILRELDRGGQVYFVHNRVHNIESVASKLRQLVPEAQFVVGHGQMPEDQLERVMVDFAAGEYDVLVCTTIIESGLDIPTVNTIIVNDADKFGLAQLYQLRGRVGRGTARAYAYLLFTKHRVLTETAEKRLRAIFEATDLGAGFHIAMKDLEIRGAGSLLGAEQSGYISAVGFDLYCQLLAQAVEELKRTNELRAPPNGAVSQLPAAQNGARQVPQPVVDVDLPALLPSSYVADLTVRLELYRRFAAVKTEAEVKDLADELQDRFGPLPVEVENLLYLVRLKLLAAQAGVQSIGSENGNIVVRMLDGRVLDRGTLRQRFGPAIAVGSSQIRLDQERLGSEWSETLESLVRTL